MIFFNGKFYQEKNLKLSPLVDSYMFGYGVFETLRTYQGRIFCLKEHLKRLLNSARVINLTHAYQLDELSRITSESFQKSGLSESRIKIVLTETELLIIPHKLVLKPDIWYQKGIKTASLPLLRIFPEAKTLNNLTFVFSHKYALSQNIPEVILVDRSGIAREGSYTNLFWIENQSLCTTKTRILKGITRDLVLKEASKIMTVLEKDQKITEIVKADEVFLTSTIGEIIPVVQIDQKVIGQGKVGEWTLKLLKMFKNKVKELVN